MIETDSSVVETTRCDDEYLVRECIQGNQSAWWALVEKYRNLIFSIPIKLGFSRDDASDVFQSVWLTLLSEMPRIREARTLAAWLIQVTAHECFRRKRKKGGRSIVDIDTYGQSLVASDKLPDAVLEELRREQILREAIADLAPRCQELIQLLFFSVPPHTYETVASQLGLATGSIGFIRMRCLDRLRRELKQRGFQ